MLIQAMEFLQVLASILIKSVHNNVSLQGGVFLIMLSQLMFCPTGCSLHPNKYNNIRVLPMKNLNLCLLVLHVCLVILHMQESAGLP